MRRTLFIAAIATLILFVAAAGGYALLQTASGQAWLAASLSRWVSSPGAQVTIEGLGGSVPFDFHVRRIELADDHGTWLTIEDAELAIAPRALLARRLEMRRLAARSLAVQRIPAAEEPAQPRSPELPSLPQLPQLPVDVALESLRIEQIQLARGILGEPVTATLEASGRLADETAEANVLLRRTDGTSGQASLVVDFHSPDQLTVRAEVVEPTGRVAQEILGTDEPAPLAVTVNGDGALESWHGTVTARVGELARLDAEIALQRRDALRAEIKGELDPGALRPARLAPLLPQPLAFAGAATFKDGVLAMEAFDVATGALAASAHGRYDTAAGRISGEMTARLPELAPLGAVAATPLDGSAELHIGIEGSPDAPRARLSLDAHDVRSGALAAKRLRARADLAPDPDSWRVTANGRLEQFAISGAELPAPPELDWDIRAAVDRAVSRIEVEHARVAGAGIAIEGAGQATALDQAAPQIEGDARLDIADLAGLGALAGLPLQGSLGLDVDARSDGAATSLRLRGETEAFSAGIAALDALLGPRAAIAATLSRQADGAITVDAARVDGANASLVAQASIPGGFERIDATGRLELPRLTPLGEAIGTPLAGAISVDAKLAGALSQPAIEADAHGSSLRIAGGQLDRMSAHLTLSDPGARDGRLSATFGAGSFEARADASFARPTPERLSIPRLTLSAPKTTLEAALDVTLDRPQVTGTITGRVADLAAWSAIAGLPLAGQADLRIALSAERGQRADIRASASGLRVSGEAAVARMRLDAQLADLFGAPSGRASLEASELAAPGLKIDSARVSAQSAKPGTFNVNVQGAGALTNQDATSALRLTAQGEVAIAETEKKLRVTRLDVGLGGYDITSKSPFVLVSGASVIRLDGLDWQIGKGRLTATAARTGERLQLNMEARGLPLGLVGSVAPGQPIDGALDAKLALSGTTAHPEGRLDARLRELRVKAGSANVPALDAVLRADWKDAVVALDGRLSGPNGTALDVSGALPLVLDPQTAMPAVPRDRAMRLAARGDGRLENWSDVLPIGEDRISGRYAIDAQVRGTIDAPEAGGRLAIDGGRYLNFAAGTELRNLELELAGDGRRFVLRKLQATDAAKGTVRASGSVDLAGASGPTADVAAKFTEFQAVRRDELTATADGTLRLLGPLNDATLSGHVRVQRAEIRIPDRLPPHIARFDVIEIDSSGNTVVAAPERSAPPSTLRLDMRLEIPAHAFVRGRGLDSEWRGSLQIAGNVERPAITGSLSVVRGNFALLGKSFALSEGTITFLGDPDTEPQIHLVAEHKAAEITAQAIVTGTLTAPTIRMSSQPEMPQDEVLARVLFGRGVGQITPAQGLQLAQAAATLAGGGPGLLDRLRMATGLDRLDISSGTDPATGTTSGPTVSGGKYVTDRVFVGVEQGTSSESTRTKVEVELTPNVTVESGVGANAAADVGVNWKWDY